MIEWDVNIQTRTIFARLPATRAGERQRARSNPAMVAKILDGYGPLGFAVMRVILMHKEGANAISVFANAVRHEAVQKQGATPAVIHHLVRLRRLPLRRRGIGLPRRLRLLARTVIEWDMSTQIRMIFARLPVARAGERQRARSNPAAMVAKELNDHDPLGFAVTGVMLMCEGGANAISVFANAVRHEAVQKQGRHPQ